MKDLVKHEAKSDCAVLEDNFINVFENLGECLDSVVDEKKTKMNVVGSLFGIVGSIGKLALNTTGCAIKNAPKAIVAVAAVKRELIEAGTQEWNKYQKQQKEEALHEKIMQLKLKTRG